MLIIELFNGVFFGMIAIFIVVFTLLSILARKKGELFARKLLGWMMVCTMVFFFVYKYGLSIDEEYSVLCAEAGIGAFSWWKELPFQLCNINMIMIPIAMLTMKRPLLNFCFFTGTLGALFALIMPCTGFSGYSILLLRILGYYGTHLMVFFGAVAIVSFGIHKPQFKEIPLTALLLLAVAFGVFIINWLSEPRGSMNMPTISSCMIQREIRYWRSSIQLFRIRSCMRYLVC